MNLVPDFLTFALASTPQRAAVVAGDRTLSFEQVDQRADRLAAWLGAQGVTAGDRVALLARNEAEYLEIQVGAMRAGAVLVPLNFRLAAPELNYILTDCSPRVLIVAEEYAALAQQLPAPVVLKLGAEYEALLAVQPAGATGLREYEPDAPCTILYTSGTTGRPKGALLNHSAMHARINTNLFEYQIRSTDRFLQCLPLFHIASNVTYSYTFAGATNVLLKDFSPEQVLALITGHQVTVALLVPTMINALINHPGVSGADLRSLNTVAYGASPIPPSVLAQAIEVLGCEFLQLFGMTETSSVTTLRRADHDPARAPERLASAGQPSIGMAVRVVDEQDRDVAAGVVGEIVCRGPTVMAGYWNAPEASAEALRGGWMHTGDLGYLDTQGYFFVTDRKKDMIISGGENVYPREVEDVLFAHPQVLEAAVIGVPDERWGERVHGLLVPRPGQLLDTEEVLAFARTRLAGYKVPKTAEVRAELPKNATGKVLKTELRAPYWKGRSRSLS